MAKVTWKEITKFVGPQESPGFLLWQVSSEWRRQIESALLEIDLTHPQFVLLASVGWLTKDGDMVSQADISRHCKTDINITSQVLRGLEKKGLIKRVRIEGNEKSKFPQITSKGARLIKIAIPLVEKIDAAFFARLGKQTKSCVNILKKLLVN